MRQQVLGKGGPGDAGFSPTALPRAFGPLLLLWLSKRGLQNEPEPQALL